MVLVRGALEKPQPSDTYIAVFSFERTTYNLIEVIRFGQESFRYKYRYLYIRGRILMPSPRACISRFFHSVRVALVIRVKDHIHLMFVIHNLALAQTTNS